MVNKFLLLLLFLSVVKVTEAQQISRNEANAMLVALKKSKKDVKRIDLLVKLAQFYIFKPGELQVDFDSALTHLTEAKLLNKKVGSFEQNAFILLTECYIAFEQGKKEESKKMAERAAEILEQSNNKNYLGQAYYHLAQYYDYRDDHQLSKKTMFVEQALQAFEQTSDARWKGRCLEMLGDLYSETDAAKAIPVLKRAIAIYDSIKYPVLQGVYVLLGVCYQDNGDYGQGLLYLLKALKTAQTFGDTSLQLCQINNQLGLLYLDIYNMNMALKYFNDALDIARKHNDQYAIFLLAINISTTYSSLEKYQQALETLALIPKQYLASNDPLDKGSINMRYLDTYIFLHQFQEAKPHVDTLLHLINENLLGEAITSNIYRVISLYYFLQKKYINARNYLSKSIEITERINYDNGRIHNLNRSYQLDSALGNFQSAFTNLRLYKAKTDSISSEKTTRQFQVLAVQHEIGMKEDSIKLKDKDIALLKERNSLQQANLRQASLVKNITIAGIILASIIISLLYHQYRNKKQSNKLVIQKNDQLQHLLGEKEWLLKEIHHRVKNNLQVVMSLLNSQSAYIESDAALNAIQDSQHRVHAMSLIHQKLYNSENLSSIEISNYIRELVSYLSDSFDAGNRIRFELNIEFLEMDVSQAVPLGLILNEAITNSIKYAFPDGRKGIVSISLFNISPEKYLLRISDNGIGMPSAIKKTGSLGMSLMKGLSEDLDGSFSIENNYGTTIKVSFVYDRDINRNNLLSRSFVTTN